MESFNEQVEEFASEAEAAESCEERSYQHRIGVHVIGESFNQFNKRCTFDKWHTSVLTSL